MLQLQDGEGAGTRNIKRPLYWSLLSVVSDPVATIHISFSSTLASTNFALRGKSDRGGRTACHIYALEVWPLVDTAGWVAASYILKGWSSESGHHDREDRVTSITTYRFVVC